MKSKSIQKALFYILSLTCILSCSLFENNSDPCDNVICELEFVCDEGNCVCPDGYQGENCNEFNPAQVQALLDDGITPLQIFNDGITVDSLYGKIYFDGYIFYLDTITGTGLLAALNDLSEPYEWGCFQNDILELNNVDEPSGVTYTFLGIGSRIGDGLNNTNIIIDAQCETTNDGGSKTAARECRNIGEDWYLPSIEELFLMTTRLYQMGIGEFKRHEFYWSSSEINHIDSWYTQGSGGSKMNTNKNRKHYVRPIKEF